MPRLHIILAASLNLTTLTLFGQADTIIESTKYKIISRYTNGKVHELGNYLIKGDKKIKHGKWIVYDINGELIEKGSYKKNIKIDLWTELKNGQCCWWGKYKHGKKDGDWFDGSNRFTYFKNGKEQGTTIVEWK